MIFQDGVPGQMRNEVGLMAAAVEVVRGTEQAASLLAHPLRLKVLEQLGEPDSASGLARRLGLPRQVINYHVKALEDAGVVQFVAERPRRGMKERLMRATARSYLISPEAVVFRFVLGAYPAITKTDEEAALELPRPTQERTP